MVTLCSSMTSRRADWVLGDVRLSSSARTMLLRTGPGITEKVPFSRSYTEMPVMSEGMVSGVHWIRAKERDSESARALARVFRSYISFPKLTTI